MDIERVTLLDSLTVESLWLAITQIEAQDIISKLMIADWPNMKKETRNEKQGELKKLAYPSHKKAPISVKDLTRILGANG